jgi:ABC-type multidrug transport system fused ATPase/permease subunit
LKYILILQVRFIAKKPKESWPESGKIAFQQVFLRYGEDSWVLKNLNFVILPQQKVKLEIINIS